MEISRIRESIEKERKEFADLKESLKVKGMAVSQAQAALEKLLQTLSLNNDFATLNRHAERDSLLFVFSLSPLPFCFSLLLPLFSPSPPSSPLPLCLSLFLSFLSLSFDSPFSSPCPFRSTISILPCLSLLSPGCDAHSLPSSHLFLFSVLPVALEAYSLSFSLPFPFRPFAFPSPLLSSPPLLLVD